MRKAPVTRLLHEMMILLFCGFFMLSGFAQARAATQNAAFMRQTGGLMLCAPSGAAEDQHPALHDEACAACCLAAPLALVPPQPRVAVLGFTLAPRMPVLAIMARQNTALYLPGSRGPPGKA